MKTTFPMYLVLGFAVAGIMLAGSGFSSGIQADRSSDVVQERVEGAAGSGVGGDGLAADSRGEAEGGSVLGFVVAGGSAFLQIMKLILFLPIGLREKGFPAWFAYPVGLMLEIVLTAGFVQFVANRVWR